MIKSVEIEMYGHKWLIEIDQYSSDEFDFTIMETLITYEGVNIDLSSMADQIEQLGCEIDVVVNSYLKQEALNNV